MPEGAKSSLALKARHTEHSISNFSQETSWILDFIFPSGQLPQTEELNEVVGHIKSAQYHPQINIFNSLFNSLLPLIC